jgi:hypothetical protein
MAKAKVGRGVLTAPRIMSTGGPLLSPRPGALGTARPTLADLRLRFRLIRANVSPEVDMPLLIIILALLIPRVTIALLWLLTNWFQGLFNTASVASARFYLSTDDAALVFRRATLVQRRVGIIPGRGHRGRVNHRRFPSTQTPGDRTDGVTRRKRFASGDFAGKG